MATGQIELTLTDIVTIIHSGKAEQNPVSMAFIKTVRQEFGLDIIACYANSNEHIVIPDSPHKRHLRLTRKKINYEYLLKHPEFIRELYVTLYLNHSQHYCEKYIPSDTKTKLLQTFIQTLQQFGIRIPYTRMLTAEESQIYGFSGKKAEERDDSKIVMPQQIPPEKHFLEIESFPGLALWHIYSESCGAIQRYLREQAGYPSVKVFCQWDTQQMQETLWICFSFSWEKDEFLSRSDAEEIRQTCIQKIKKHDMWNLVTEQTYHPIYIVWNELSDEERFHFMYE